MADEVLDNTEVQIPQDDPLAKFQKYMVENNADPLAKFQKYKVEEVKKKEPTHEALQYGQDATNLSKIVGQQNGSQSQSTSTTKPSLKSYLQGEQQPLPNLPQPTEGQPKGVKPIQYDLNTALDNTAQTKVKAKGLQPTEANINAEKQNLKKAFDNGDVDFAEGGKTLGRVPTAMESLVKGFYNTVSKVTDDIDMMSAKTKEERQTVLDNINKRKTFENSEDFNPYDVLKSVTNPQMAAADIFAKSLNSDENRLPTAKPSTLGKGTEFAGGIAPKALAASFGIIPTAIQSVMTNVPDKVLQIYNEKQNEGYSKDEALDLAYQHGVSQSAPASYLDALLFKGGAETPAAKNLSDALVGGLKGATKMGLKGTAAEAATIGIEAAEGDKPHDIANRLKNTFGNWFVMDATVRGLHILPSLPKYLQSAIKEYAIQPDVKPLVDAQLQQMPNGAEIKQSLDNYEQATQPLRGIVPDEKMPIVGGRVEKINNLTKDIQDANVSKMVLPEAIHPEIDKKIEEKQTEIQNTNKEIKEALKSDNPLSIEKDDVTGEPIIKNEKNNIQQPTENTKPIEEEINQPIGKAKEAEPTGEISSSEIKPITKDAEDLLNSISEGSKPAFITKNMERIAKDNGIEVTDKSTPDEIINQLKEKQTSKPIEQTPTVSDGKIKVFRGTGKNVKQGENDAVQWVAEDNRVAQNYSSDGNTEQIEVDKPKNPFEMPINTIYVKGSDIGNKLRGIRDKLFKTKKIGESEYENITNKIDDFVKKAGEESELYSTKTNKKESAKPFVEALKAMGYDGLVQKESYSSGSPFTQTKTGEETNTYGIFKPTEQPKETNSIAPTVSEPLKEGFTEGKDLNKIFSDLKNKYGDKKGSSLYEVANRLVNPNKNTIVEVRGNGVVVKEGDKYILKPFGNTDANMKQWTLYKGLDVTDQFEQPKETKSITPNTENNAIQEPSTGSLLQHTQEGIGEKGSERTGMESSKQGNETTTQSKEQTNGEKPIGEVDEGDYTSLKKRIYDTERDAEGKPILDTSSGKSAVEKANETKAKIESGEISQQEIDDIQSALANGTDINTKLKPEEIEHVLLYNKNKLNKEGRELNKQYNEIPQSDHEGVMNKGFELVRNQELKDENYIASKKFGAEWGRQGQARQLSIDNDYTFEHLKDRIEQHLDDKNIPEPVKAKLKILSDKIGDLQDKLDDHTKKLQEHEEALKKSEEEKLKLEEENSKLKAEQTLEDKKEQAKRERSEKRGDLAKQKKDTIEQIKARYNKLRGSANSGLNFNMLELAPEIAKLARIYVQDAIEQAKEINIDELVDKIHGDLKDFIEGITHRDVRDAFSGYGVSAKPSDKPVDIELSKLKSHAKALSGLEDVKEKNQAPLRSGLTRREPTNEVVMLRKQINDEMRKRGIDIRKAKDPEKVWKTALESFKTRTENRIKYLENVKKINDIEKYKQEQQRVKLKLDKEGNDLKTKAEIEKNRVEGLIRQYEFEKWNKFDKAMHYVNRLSKGIMISNPAVLVKILGSVVWRGAAKIPSTLINLGVSKLMPSISKVEGINSLNDAVSHIGKYYSTLFSKENWKGIKDAFKNKSNNEDLLYGKEYFKETIPKVDFSTNWGNPVKALGDVSKASFFWTLRALEKNAAAHGAEKSAASKPEFEAYKQTINRNFQRYKDEISGQLIKEGLLPKEYGNEHVQELVNQLAFQKSLRAKFMQDNKVSGVQKVVEGHFRNTGNIGIAEGINTLLPITKIGSNFTGEALEQHPIIGAIPQLRNIFNYAINGESALTTKQKNNVVRALTNQGVGAACYLIGAYAYKSINPFYQSSAKKYADKTGKELPEDKNDIGIIPEIWAHSPYAMNIRAGASHAWVWDKYDEANPDESVMSKFFNTTLDAFQENLRAEMAFSPYISTGESTIAPLVGSGDFGKAAANFVKGRIPFSTTIGEVSQGKVPILNNVAPELSKKIGKEVGLKEESVKPTDIGLKPKGFMQNMGIGLPLWREKVIQDMYDEKYNKERKLPDVEKKINSREDKLNKKDKTEIFKQEHNLQ